MTINCERQQRSSGSSPYFTTGCPLSPQNAVSSCGFLSLAHPPCFSLPQSRSWLAFDSVHHLPSTCASTRWLLSPWKQLSHKSPTSFSFSLLLKPALTWCRISSLASYVLMFILLSFFFFNTFIYFIYLFLAALGLRCCARAFSSCGEWGLLFVAVCGLLIAVSSLVAEHGL